RAAAHPVLPSFPTRRSSDLTLGSNYHRLEPAARLDFVGQLLCALLELWFEGRIGHVSVEIVDRYTRQSPPKLAGIVSHPVFAKRDRKSTRLNSSHVKISYAV